MSIDARCRRVPGVTVACGRRDAQQRWVKPFVSLFAERYISEQPVHPDRAFRGRDQVRANWSAVLVDEISGRG